MEKNNLTEERLTEKIHLLLDKEDISSKEREVLLKYIMENNDGFMKKINDLKTNISKLQLIYGFDFLNVDMLELYTEICRQYPTTGPSSIFNRFIKK